MEATTLPLVKVPLRFRADKYTIGCKVTVTISDTMTAQTAFAALSLPEGVCIVTYCMTSTVGFTIEVKYTGCRQSSSGAAYSCVGAYVYIVSVTSATMCDLKTNTSVTLETSDCYHKAMRIA